MKNPLVDALRQAADPLKRPETAPSAAPEELKLFDTFAIDTTVKTANDELDADFYAGTSLQMGQDDEMQIVVGGPAGRVRSRAALASKSGGSGVARLGRYSPWLSLALLLATSAVYFIYQYLGGRYQNVDLQLLSSQVDASAGEAAAVARFVNPLQLIAAPAPSESANTIAPRADVDAVAASTSVAVPAAVPDRAFAILNSAYRAFEAGDLAAAEHAYREALRLAPRHPNALHGLAAVLRRGGRSAESLQLYSVLLSVDPQNTAAIAALLLEQGDRPAAAREIRFLLQEHADSASLNFALANVLAEQSLWVEASFYFGRAVQFDAGNADYLFNYALSLERQGKFAAARREYQAALQASNANSAVHQATLLARIEQLAEPAGARGDRQ